MRIKIKQTNAEIRNIQRRLKRGMERPQDKLKLKELEKRLA